MIELFKNEPLSRLLPEWESPVHYLWGKRDTNILLNDFLGQTIQIKSHHEILCTHCGKKTPKSYNRGSCYLCFRQKASNDLCIVKPELCHYTHGSCREPEWGMKHCLIPHCLYLSQTSGIKVGITREHRKFTRWMDQGAVQAIVLGIVPGRLESGIIEVEIAKHIADKTHWRRMLQKPSKVLPLPEYADRFRKQAMSHTFFQPLSTNSPEKIDYPVLQYPEKVRSMTLDKQECIAGTLLGIKGQYLIMDHGVFNVARHSGYVATVSISN